MTDASPQNNFLSFRAKFHALGERFDKGHIFKWLAFLGGLLALWQFYDSNRNAAKQAQYQAWLLLNSSDQKAGNGGRTIAIERLNADGATLDEVSLVEAYVVGLRIDGVRLQRGLFDRATADYARLRRADLQGSSAKGSKFRWACFFQASLADMDFSDAVLTGADFRGADLRRAKLIRADLTGAMFDKADLSGVDLSKATVSGASFRGSNLSGAKLDQIGDWRRAKDFTAINFRDARAVPEGFTQEVKNNWKGEDSFSKADSEWKRERDLLTYEARGIVCNEKLDAIETRNR